MENRNERCRVDTLRGKIQKNSPLIPSNRITFWTELEENDEAVDLAANI